MSDGPDDPWPAAERGTAGAEKSVTLPVPVDVLLTYRKRDDDDDGPPDEFASRLRPDVRRHWRIARAVGVEAAAGRVLRVVEKHAELPCARTAGFATRDPGRRVAVYYGDGDRPADNAPLGAVTVYRPPGYEDARARAPRTAHIAVTVRVSVDTSGVVTVRRECAARERPRDNEYAGPWRVPSVPSRARHPGHSFAHTGALSVARFEFQPLCLVCDPELRCRTHRHVGPFKRSVKKSLSFVFNAACVCSYFHWLRAERALVDIFRLTFFGYHEVEFTRSEQAFVQQFPYDDATFDSLTGEILLPSNDSGPTVSYSMRN